MTKSESKKNNEKLLLIIFCAITLSMGSAIAVVGIINEPIDSNTAIILLGIGQFCSGLVLLNLVDKMK